MSVSLRKATPSAWSCRLSALMFSLMPLCTTAMRPGSSVWGWAFSSVTPPWVAHRVWAMPAPPKGGLSSFSARSATRPTARRDQSSPSLKQADTGPSRSPGTPDAAGPRRACPRAQSGPMYATIPHIPISLSKKVLGRCLEHIHGPANCTHASPCASWPPGPITQVVGRLLMRNRFPTSGAQAKSRPDRLERRRTLRKPGLAVVEGDRHDVRPSCPRPRSASGAWRARGVPACRARTSSPRS